MDEDIKQMLCRHRENMEKTVSSLKMKLARSAEEHDKVYVKLMKVNQWRSVSSAAMTDPSVFVLSFFQKFTECLCLCRRT